MTTYPDFEGQPCEVVVPIVLRVPIYIEPVVIERTAVCYGNSHSEVVGLKQQLSDAGPVTVPNGTPAQGTQPVAHLNIDGSNLEAVNQVVRESLQPISNGLNSFGHAIQDLFETGMSGRARFGHAQQN
ncbi:MAG: hypothetical protein AAGA83_22395 [Cyanobacteria bacterium P01_F01_bin.116]